MQSITINLLVDLTMSTVNAAFNSRFIKFHHIILYFPSYFVRVYAKNHAL